jgi:hypothetical protein
MRFLAESSLSLLSEPHLKRLRRNGFKAILPGIESWYSLGNKSKTGAATGMEKVRQVAEHVNTILRYIPYVQTNFVLGLDCDAGAEPFELTTRFIDLTPGAYPAFSLLTCYGAAAPLNLELQRAGRVVPFPFHFLDSNHAMNVRPLNYDWAEFYAHAEDLSLYAHSPRQLLRRMSANRGLMTKGMNLVRACSSGRAKYQGKIRRMLAEQPAVRAFFDGETTALPAFYRNRIRRQMGTLWDALPEGALMHDQNAYLKRHEASARLAAE